MVVIRITDLDEDMDTDSYRDTGMTCLGGGMHCPFASSYLCYLVLGEPRCRIIRITSIQHQKNQEGN